MTEFVRTKRRANGADHDDYSPEAYVAGPWHQMLDRGMGAQTWCGKKMTGVFNKDRSTETPTEGATCRTCARAVTNNQPVPYRRGR